MRNCSLERSYLSCITTGLCAKLSRGKNTHTNTLTHTGTQTHSNKHIKIILWPLLFIAFWLILYTIIIYPCHQIFFKMKILKKGIYSLPWTFHHISVWHLGYHIYRLFSSLFSLSITLSLVSLLINNCLYLWLFFHTHTNIPGGRIRNVNTV